ncbi:MAG TPA: hypothetical protein VNQ74_15390 [Burkholderiaceae bacterium]|nr:hypothetical protein [Burkholderiaceae bacterium]
MHDADGGINDLFVQGFDVLLMDQFGADARQESRVGQFGFKLGLRVVQRFISPATLDKIRRLASVQIQTMQFGLAGPMHRPEVSRNHTQRLAAATNERSG